jgi:hypothetical protein
MMTARSFSEREVDGESRMGLMERGDFLDLKKFERRPR